MKINLAKSAGFCFGVKRAIEIALRTAHSNKNVYMLGDIVHNENVVKEIRKNGIRRISRLTSGKNKTLLIRAHGASLKTVKEARRLGYDIIDATCPMVKEIHRIVKDMENKNYRVIIIGDKAHEEVRGIIGQLKSKAVVITDKRIPLKIIKGIKKACVVAQSTQNLDKVIGIVDNLKVRIKNLRFFNTICKPTRTKQEEIKNMPLENDVMVIIGSKNSANTRRLYEISKSLNKNSFWVNSPKDIKPKWLRKAKSVGVTAGASTPESTTKKIIKYLNKN